ncbi:pimeloyl-ACP methyl ester carboxylesterase [Friedmanniella endophytica]|uniref:Pimeloyl-ACP methyl ester carboxylesterase n=1 Tax=Microlunatus kandeliicorticis TaxID=1759536 RepID=A0A7W3IRH8_9ACTN|nr:alpha/beta hydrolase [Microlunatus kandeliicorticis]MBA8793840.1 pimeloyl-ACP methyl ester carboxylesterase [Microlunatus kandeliicorticis]
MRRRLLRSLLALTLVAGTLTAGGSVPTAGAAPARPSGPAAPAGDTVTLGRSTVAWKACSDPLLDSYGLQCATIKVPLDYAKPSGTKISVAVSRLRHTSAHYQGPMLINTGGPGGSGLLGPVYLAGSMNAMADYDLIGFDPRGVGASRPLVSCDPKYAGFNRPDYRPWTSKEYDAWMKKTRAYTTACGKKNGKILVHMSTRANAKDMDSIRKALGAPTINYWGWSYGTYLGQVYASLFPKQLRRAVFDSTVDPRRVWYGANLDQDVAFDKNMNTWFGWLARYDRVYHLGTTQTAVRNRFYAIQEKLYAKPVNTARGRIGGSEWIDTFLDAGYYQSSWTSLGTLFNAYAKHNAAAKLAAAYQDASGYGDDNGYAVYLGVQCTDTSWPTSWSRWSKDSWNTWAKAPFETWGNTWYNEPCRHWPGFFQKPVPVVDKGVSSILMIDETLDAATPYSGSLEVRKRFRNARLVAEPGGTSHAMSPGWNSCVDARIQAYLATGAMPRRVSNHGADAVCTATAQPDPTAFDRSAARTARPSGPSDRALELINQRHRAVGRP